MRVLHCSDTHGYLLKLLGKFDVVVHSGDFFPNSQYVWSNRVKEMEFQLRWLEEKIPLLKEWLQNHPFLFTLGNHDFLNPDLMAMKLNEAGIKAFSLNDNLVTHQGVNFYGFSWIPYINGTWMYECTPQQIEPHIDQLVNTLNTTYVDVLVAHPPLFKCLDVSNGNQYLGSTALTNALDMKISKDMLPQVMLCGHIHEAQGVSIRNGMLISNAATTQRIIEL